MTVGKQVSVARPGAWAKLRRTQPRRRGRHAAHMSLHASLHHPARTPADLLQKCPWHAVSTANPGVSFVFLIFARKSIICAHIDGGDNEYGAYAPACKGAHLKRSVGDCSRESFPHLICIAGLTHVHKKCTLGDARSPPSPTYRTQSSFSLELEQDPSAHPIAR